MRVDPHAPPARKKRFALTLGRICPEKAFHLAIDAAALAGVPIAVGGRVFPYPEHEAYWRDEIEPRLSRRASFIGVLGPRAKRRWLSSAQCLVVPSVVEETSSLVAMEAQAAGTPVVAFRLGALEEIVEDGRPGFLVPPADVDGLARGIQRSAEIDPEACRRRARERFDVAETAKRYLDLYARIARADRLAAAGPS